MTDTEASQNIGNDELLPVGEGVATFGEKNNNDKAAYLTSRLSPDEKRAGLTVLGCFLFQEVDSNVFRVLLLASVVAYALTTHYITTNSSDKSTSRNISDETN